MKKKHFFVRFRRFFVDFSREITEKGIKSTIRLKTAEKSSSTSFQVRCCKHLKAGRNTQQLRGQLIIRKPNLRIFDSLKASFWGLFRTNLW